MGGWHRAWLDGLGLLPGRIDELMAAWAAEADDRGLRRLQRAYWDQARPWLQERALGRGRVTRLSG